MANRGTVAAGVRARAFVLAGAPFLLASACHRGDAGPNRSEPTARAAEAPAQVATAEAHRGPPTIRYVFVIAMENTDAAAIYGDTTEAPYINGVLLPRYAHATRFVDELPLSVPSEPHYIWLESGTNAFADAVFTTDEDPSEANSTADPVHLTTQIRDAKSGVTWRTYQEGMGVETGACPIHAAGLYAPKHDPFVFFRDVTGDPPSEQNAYCAAHHRSYASIEHDLRGGDVATYTFITPDLCHDMHGAPGCFDESLIRRGDDWLSAELPRLIAFADDHQGVIFLEWDEGASSAVMPFLVIGPGVKAGYAGGRRYDHGSILKSIEAILGLPTIPRVAAANDLADLFQPGHFP